jgi:aldehyde:ferredoxin oxidoreductase
MGEAIKVGEDVSAVINALETCTRTGGSFELMTRALSAATGLDFTVAELLKIGERIFNVEKAFNAREGLTRKDDNFSVPEKFTTEPIAEGPCRGEIVNLKPMLDAYYRAREWDVETGLQTKVKLDELDLQHIIPELEKVNAVK